MRQPTGLEQFTQKIASTLPRGYVSKVNEWIGNINYQPTIEQIMAKLEAFQEEVDKYKDADKQFTQEEKEARRKQVEEMKKSFLK